MNIYITNKANIKLKEFVTLVNSEISGIAKSKITEEKDIIITDFMIFNQEVSGASTIISDESQAKFLNEIMKQGHNTADWNVWWHSHCDMDVFWSGTDENTIREHTNQSYLISLVVNKKMEMKARLDIFPKDLSPFKKESYCRFDINNIEIIKTNSEKKIELQYEKEMILLEKEFDKKIELLEKKYKADNKNIKNFCQKEIKQKVKSIIIPLNKYYNYDYKGQRWDWINGIKYLDKYNNNFDKIEKKYKVNNYNQDCNYNDDFFNKQNPQQIGFNY